MKNKTNIASAHSTKLLFQDIASHCEVSKRHRLFTICKKGCPSEAATSRASRTCSSAFSPNSMELLTFASSLKSSSLRASMSSRSVVSKERPEKLPYPSMYPSSTSGRSARDIFNDCVVSPTQHCWLKHW